MLSVIVPVYNAENYIKKCLLSITNQTYFDLEIIIVDDGSSDKSVNIIKEIMAEDHRIKLFIKENGGVSSARNFGIEVSNGEYITFVDADDFIDESMYMCMMDKFNSDIDIVCCGINLLNENYKKIDELHTVKFGTIIDSKDAVRYCLEGNIMGFNVYTKIFKRRLFFEKNIRFPLGKIMEEAQILPDIFELTKKIYHIGEPKYYYYKHSNTYTTKPYTEEIFHVYDVIEHFNQRFKNDISINKALRKYKFEKYISIYREASFRRKFIKQNVYSRIKKEFYRIFLPCLFSNISFKRKLLAIETFFHIHLLRKKRIAS